MKLSPLRIFSIKLAMFSVALAYLAVDLFVWHGPVWNALHAGEQEASGVAEDAVTAPARVYGESISAEQLARYTAEQNWLRDRGTDITPGQRAGYLMDMVREAILRIRTRYNDKNLPDFSAAAAEEVERLASRARDRDDFERWLSSQGYTREQYTRKLALFMKMRAQLERALAPHCLVRDEDVAKHYELIKDDLRIPEHREVRHIFFATLDKNPDKVHARAASALRRLRAGEDFAALARRLSEDDASAEAGGELGVLYNDEHLALPELPLFGEHAAPADEPTLARSRWGWHILVAGPTQPSRIPSLDETRESLRSAIRSAQYELAVRAWFEEAIREAFSKKHLEIHVN